LEKKYSSKFFSFLLPHSKLSCYGILLFLFLGSIHLSAGNPFQISSTPSSWSAGFNSAPGKLKVFEENKGQYLNPVNNWKVEYVCKTEGSMIFFTSQGIIYSVPKTDEKKAVKSEEDEESENSVSQAPAFYYVLASWPGSNQQALIIAQDEAPFVFNSSDAKDHSIQLNNMKGFKKLTYKNIYPGIDIEFTFHPQQGIKYTLIVQQGTDARNFSMHYEGQEGLHLDKTGNLHIKTEAGDILDHAPVTVTSSGTKIKSAFFLSGKDKIRFTMDAADAVSGLVIDPWTVTPVIPPGSGSYVPADVEMDAANNAYILGMDATTKEMYVQKYTPAGTLAWTYQFTEFGSSSWQSDLAVDPAGNSYVAAPKPYTNANNFTYAAVGVNTSGVRIYFYNTYNANTIFETLSMAYSCTYATLVQSGAGFKGATGNITQVAVMTPGTGVVGAVATNNNTGEIYASCVAPNGNWYGLASDSNSVTSGTYSNGSFDNLMCYTITGTTVTYSWQKHIDYNFIDYHAKAGPKKIGTNGIVASCAYLYTSDGVNLDQRSLTNGTLIRRVTIPGGSNTTAGNFNSGLAVDLKCGYLYVGGVNNMYVYDANLNPIFTYTGLPGIVYGVAYNNSIVSVCGATAGNVGFVAQYPAQTCTTNITHINPTCGASNGSATVTPTFCSGPYTYLWSPSGQTTATASGLPAGLYTVQIGTNSFCVTVSDTVTLRPTTGGTEAITGTNVNCAGGTNGSATTTMTGGTAPFTYTWSPAPGGGQGTATATGLAAGTYTCTVNDNAGCNTTLTVVITQPTPLATTNSQVNVVCNGGTNGSATVTASGGTAAYTYSWSPSGGTAATATGLAAGTYTCTVTDSKACTTTSTLTITQPPALAATTSTVPALCGSNNGSASISASGGTPAYTYSWNTTPAQTTATASNLTAGTFTCTLTDASGCTMTATASVTSTGGPVVTSAPPVNVTCFGACNGSDVVSVTGGTAPYTYSWSPAPGSGQGTVSAGSMCAGTFTCNVTDATGCLQSSTIIITQPTAITLTPSNTNVSCFGGANGTAGVGASGGTSTYTYAWTPVPGAGQGTPNATSLTAGSYTIMVTDANGCKDSSVIPITQPTLLTVSASGLMATCNGKCNGQLICIPNGGSTAYSYSWSSGCTAASCNNVCSGHYTVSITDAHGCIATDTTTVTEPAPLAMTMGNKPSICNKPDGKDSVTVTGGTTAYTYSWSPGAGSTNAIYNNILAGTYTVYVQDSHGCRDSSTNTVANLPGVNISNLTSTPVTCFNGTDGTATDSAWGGYKPYTFVWSPAPGGGQGSLAATGLPAGTYTCTVTDSASCTNSATVTIVQPTPLALTAMPAARICIGQCIPITAAASGGSPGYTYSWTQNGTPVTSPVCPVVTTTYTVAVTDSHGCVVAPATVTINVNPPLEVTTAGATVCPGISSTLQAIGSGGDSIYSYHWIPATGLNNPNIPNPIATPAVTTTYTVIVSDNCGTPTDSAMATITLYPNPVALFTCADSVHCAPVCATFTGTSNPPCASAVWTFGDGTTATGCNTAQHCYYVAGTYNITYSVTDIHGCVGSYTIPNYINALPDPIAAFTDSPNPATVVDPLIFFTDESTNAISWLWSFGDLSGATSTLENPNYSYPDTGCYVVQLTVTAPNGCKDSVRSPICIEPDFTFYAPNTFTPNGDGKNDVWMPFGIGIDVNNYHLMMFDRWGNLMFETYKWDEGWNGRANGGANIAQIDTYVWKVDLKDFKGNRHHYEGHCNLIK
jgi:gliding motility-associated-like protein